MTINTTTLNHAAYHGEKLLFFDNPGKNPAASTSLLDIFPNSNSPITHSDQLTTLKKYLRFIMLAQEALAKFEKRVMPFFDPLVGENACQIRAAMFAEMLDKDGIDEHIGFTRNQLADHADKIKELITHQNVKFQKVDSFKSFLQQNDAILEISEEISVIISSFILSETKIIEYKPNDFGVPYRQDRIPYKNFGQKKGLTPKFAFAIIKVAQARLSEISVSYIQRLALQLPFSKDENDTSMLVFGNFVKLDERHRKLTPFFPTVRLILSRMHKSKIPLILKIKQYIKGQSESYGNLSLVFGNQGTDDYSFMSNHPERYKKGAVFIHTKSITEKAQKTKVLKEKILKHKITDLILSAAADHPAYGCDDKDRPEDPLCDRYRNFAHEWGTCRSNPSLFMVEHVCCDLVYIDSRGSIVETIYLSVIQKVTELYDTISDLGCYDRQRLRILGGGKIVRDANKVVDLTMAETNLKGGTTIIALEHRYAPNPKIPIRKYKLKIIDSKP